MDNWTPETTLGKTESISEEIADILIYILLLSEKLGIDPLKAAHEKIQKNEDKYPADMVKGKSYKYNQY